MKKKNDLLILLLTVGVFGIINTEMGIIGILPLVAKSFNVSLSTAGLLVSGFAFGVAIAGPTMPLIFSKMDRKKVMLLALGIFCLSNIITIFTHNFTLLLIARIIPAFFQPVYVALAFTMATQISKPEDSQRAVARIFVGVSAGMVLGVPVTNFIATNFSFAAAMALFAIINTLVLLLTIFFVPSMPVSKPVSYGDQLGVLKTPALFLALVSVISLNAAVFGSYSYMSDFLSTVSHFSANSISILLLIYGVANIIGNMIAGNTLSVKPRETVTVVPIIALGSYLLLFLLGDSAINTIALLIAIGVVAGVIGNINQYLISYTAKEAPDLANGLFLTSANLGTTIGTAVCGALLDSFSISYIFIGVAVFLLTSSFLITAWKRFS